MNDKEFSKLEYTTGRNLVYAAQFFEKPIYKGIKEANARICKDKQLEDYILMSSPTACGTGGLDDS